MAISVFSSRKASKLAIAAAIMGVGAFGVTSFDAPAYAQSQKPNFSKEFLAAAAPLDEALKAEAPDYTVLKPQAEALTEVAKTPDDRNFAGSTLYSIGTATEDAALQRRGIELMLESGKVPETALGQYTYVAGQLAYNAGDYAAARERLEEAVELGYSVEDARTLIANSYSQEGDTLAALQQISAQLNQQVAAGQTPDEDLIKRGLTLAYNDDLYEDATNFSVLLIENYPSNTVWGDAIAIQRNLLNVDDAGLLDLLRLARVTDALREERDYIDFINTANFRRLPAEVGAVAQEGVDAGLLTRSDPFVAEAIDESDALVSGLRSDLGALERDARTSAASANAAMAAGNVFLNFGQYDKAAEYFELASNRTDGDVALAAIRLGIAQALAGNFAEAQVTLAKVQGDRAPIARLWATYAAQQASGG